MVLFLFWRRGICIGSLVLSHLQLMLSWRRCELTSHGFLLVLRVVCPGCASAPQVAVFQRVRTNTLRLALPPPRPPSLLTNHAPCVLFGLCCVGACVVCLGVWLHAGTFSLPGCASSGLLPLGLVPVHLRSSSTPSRLLGPLWYVLGMMWLVLLLRKRGGGGGAGVVVCCVRGG